MEAYLSEMRKRKKENTVVSYARDLLSLSRYYEGKTLAELTEQDLNRYFSHLSKTSSGSTLSRAISAVKGYYRFRAEEDSSFSDPSENVTASSFSPKAEPEISEEEFQMLLNFSSPGIRGRRDEAMILLLCETGISVSELVSLDRSDILPEELAVWCGKGEKRRKLFISSQAMKRLEQVKALSELSSPSERALFLGYTGQRMTRQGFWKNLKERAMKLGICDCTPQVLRRSFARHQIFSGRTRRDVKRILGNRSDAQLRMYEKQVKEK